MKPTHPYKGTMTYYSAPAFGSREVTRSQDDNYEYTYIGGELTEQVPLSRLKGEGFNPLFGLFGLLQTIERKSR